MFGDNYGFRTIIEFEDECEEDVTCQDDEEPTENEDKFTEEQTGNTTKFNRHKRGLLCYFLKKKIFSIIGYF